MQHPILFGPFLSNKEKKVLCPRIPILMYYTCRACYSEAGACTALGLDDTGYPLLG
jgi:hypothetical protein